MKKITGKLGVKYLKYSAIAIGAIGLSYSAGTFVPNAWTANNIIHEAEQKIIEEWNDFGFIEPSIEYSNNDQFISAVSRCIDFINLHTKPENRIARDVIVAMAILETGYGESRFAQEGNNLFGIRTWKSDVPQLKAKGNPTATWGVKKYKTKCSSVKDMIRIINTHPAYADFRLERTKQHTLGIIDIDAQVDQLHKWSTNPDYTMLVKNRIKTLQGTK